MADVIVLPSDEVLTYGDIKVYVWFTGEADGRAAVIMPMYNGYSASEAEQAKYRVAVQVVVARLEERGWIVDG